MFTGIVEEVGTIKQIHREREAMEMDIQCRKMLEDIQIGDSISVNGVCLTVTRFDASSFSVDVMPETFQATSLKSLGRGDAVNLELAMAAGGRFGGHFVTGHVDGTGVIKNRYSRENALYMEISLPGDLTKYMLSKGSVAVDGTSLTIFDLTDSSFTISLIPHTQEVTILSRKSQGDVVNIECDMLTKYVYRMLNRSAEKRAGGITMEDLKTNGFLD
ncbi:riboflavin synthase alpha chain [Melghiribacillus thermohalophilus]|uniref:Riboflavin synthase n=1 Tax=Melghiribacillus thermohalophilus TaxID=1324956 RepID=A0A4R3MRS2_9BACI|nr:riboflavin synthase [Melghiribacillus thermohalophilus]TCT19060.1 riboflavin synthase alpha chain [Melghiribacillus thermohalophilus]